jgi:hypothetical protein
MPDFGEVIKGRAGAVTTNVDALSSAGLALRNAGGQNVALLGAGGGQATTFYDGVNITGVLDQASATTLAIGTNNATAITLGKAGITTTVAGALTSSQLLTASLGLTITGGTAATEKIARTAADTLDINNGAIVTSATAITLAKATTVTGNLTVTRDGANVIPTFASYGTSFFPVMLTQHGRGTASAPTQVKSGDYVSQWQSYAFDNSGTPVRRVQFSIDVIATADITGTGQSKADFLMGATTALSLSSAGAVTIPTNTIHTLGTSATNANTSLHIRAGTTTAGNAGLNLYSANATASVGVINFISNTSPRWGIFTGQSTTAAGIGLTGFVADAFHLYNASDALCWQVLQTGEVRIPYAYSSTTANAANVYVDTQGGLSRSTSSLKYKTNLNFDDVVGLPLINRLQLFSYSPIEDNGKRYLGLGAETLFGIEPRLVSLDANGEPDGVHYANLTVPLAKAIQELSAKLDEARAEISALKAA